ncbi:MAG: hypothetical protein LBU90_04680 [Bacteroidales bacterium]|jgi:hypothetical protein|nr:hypothetical protein [Bacteroidales bacterium]
MRKVYTITLLILVGFSVHAQRIFNHYKYELLVGVGPTFFLGDLGGGPHIGRHSIADLDFLATRIGGSVGMRYIIDTRFSINSAITFGMISGNDEFTEEEFRSRRDLTFRSPIYEFNVRGEYKLIQETRGHIYLLKGVEGQRGNKFVVRVNAGLGVFYFNPKAPYEGKWYELQPIGTEGQNFMATRRPYSRVQLCIPTGIEASYAASRYWTWSIEIGPRFTFTDYIDDVSTSYPNPDLVAAVAPDDIPKDAARYFSNPKWQENRWYNEKRGNSFNNDMYIVCLFKVHYKMKETTTGAPKFTR